MLFDLLHNAALLVALSALYAVLVRFRKSDNTYHKVIAGVFFGLIAVIGMMFPVHLEYGVIYDGRSIVLTLAGLFGGGTASVSAIVVAGAYRAYLGGAGVWAGLATIVCCTVIGLVFRRTYRNRPDNVSLLHLYGIGWVSHVAMLICQLLIRPWPRGLSILETIWLPVLIVFPAATALMALLFSTEERRVRAEERLVQSEGRFREIFEKAELIAVMIAPDGTVSYCNDYLLQLTGWMRDEVIGYSWFDRFLPEEDREAIHRMFLESVRVGNLPKVHENPIVTRKGERRLIVWNNVLMGTSEEPDGTASIGRDVTEERRMQQLLRAADERFRLAFLTSPDSININRLSDGLYIDINEGFCQITGYRREEVIGKTSLEINIWVDPEDRKRLVEGLLRDGIVRNLEAKFRMKDGSHLDGLMSAAVIELEGVPHILTITRDISERKRLENELRESERRYRALFEDHAAIELLIDPETGRIVDANHAALNFYGWSREQLTGMRIQEINTLTPEEVRQEMESARKRRRNHFEFKHRRADGSISDVRVFSGPIEIAGKQFLHSIILDISNEKRLEAQLLQAQKMESVGQLAGGVAHDFNNLLQVMNGYAELLIAKYGPEHEIGTYVQKMLDAGNKASQLVQQLLAFSRRQLMRPEVLNLNHVIEGTLKMLHRVIGEHIDIRFIAGHKLGAVYADRTMMEQVLMNLCINARDAMSEGGEIIIETENVFIDEHYCELHEWARIGRYVLLSVTDSGSGMSQELMGRIFEPFFTTKETGKGTGLGLSTVYGIVKQHEGMIHVYSEEGKGTTFKIYLPVSERAATDVGNKIKDPVPLGNETILVVEDSEEVRHLAREILERAGYRVIEARDGQEAIEMIESGAGLEAAAYLIDVVMPRKSGWDVYQFLCSQKPGCRVLFMSGYSENAVHTNYVLKSGCHLVQKPFSRESLLKELRKVIEQG
ncbi:MAG: PAS domain S-box protein [Thermodesulfobacteriota bacterium]